MSAKQTKVEKRRLRSSYFTSTLSITLLLTLLGVVGLLLLHTKKLSDYVKENLLFKVVIQENTPEAEIYRIQKALDAKSYVKETNYITKEQAAYELQELLGEDFIKTLGYNPLKPVIEVKFLASYANNDSISRLVESDLREFTHIKNVYYQKNLIHLVNENVRKISLGMLVFCAFLFLIATALINNTIRLSVYSKRFIIRTMQLVGATHGFIRRPFIWRGVFQGLVGASFSIAIITSIIYLLRNEMVGIIGFTDFRLLVILFCIIIFAGVLLNGASTYFAVNKYLRMKTDKLYT